MHNEWVDASNKVTLAVMGQITPQWKYRSLIYLLPSPCMAFRRPSLKTMRAPLKTALASWAPSINIIIIIIIIIHVHAFL